jgi:hypothetical protein
LQLVFGSLSFAVFLLFRYFGSYHVEKNNNQRMINADKKNYFFEYNRRISINFAIIIHKIEFYDTSVAYGQIGQKNG